MKQILEFIIARKEHYIRDWKKRDGFEKYGFVVFVIIMVVTMIFAPESKSRDLSKYLNALTIVYLALMFRRIKKAKQLVDDKNTEIEHQKRLLENKQREIIDSIYYAKRIQTALFTSEKYIEKSLTNMRKG